MKEYKGFRADRLREVMEKHGATFKFVYKSIGRTGKKSKAK